MFYGIFFCVLLCLVVKKRADLPLLLVGRMVLEHRFAEVLYVEVGVYLGGGKVLVPEELLDDAQVRAVTEQVGGKRVAERMRGDVLVDARSGAEPLDDGEDHCPRQLLPAPVHERPIGMLRRDIPMRALRHPIAEPLLRHGGDRHKALLAALALDEHVALAAVHVGQFEVHQFGHAQPAAVQHLDDGAVAVTLVGREVDGGYQRIDFLHRQHHGQAGRYLGSFQQLGHIGIYIVVVEQKAVERADAGNHARLGLRLGIPFEGLIYKLLQVSELRRNRMDVVQQEERRQFAHVLLIGGDRVVGAGAFQLEVRAVLAQEVVHGLHGQSVSS